MNELAFVLENLGVSDDEIRARVAETASFFGIQNWFHRNTFELSGGEKQLLNLAAVMVMQPEVLILDEPTSRLDPIATHAFLQTVSRINTETGTTVIISEHSLEEAFCMADNVAVLKEGVLCAVGSPREVATKLYEENDLMADALPSATRIFLKARGKGICPLTVREGRTWFSGMKPESLSLPESNASKTDTILRLKNVWFRYGKESPDVLKGTSAEVSEGEIYAVLGGNGAGKSTLLACIAGVGTPYSGKIEIKKGKKTVLMPQEPETVFLRKTVYLDLGDAAKKSGYTDEKARVAVQNAMDFCEITKLSHMHPYDLSGGEQQRTALAAVLLCKPDILLLDEPTKGLDVHFKKKFAAKLKALKSAGMTIVMVSHDIEFCAEAADRCAMFFDGRIVSENTPRKFFVSKSFYTTTASRISRSIAENVVLQKDLEKSLGITESRDNAEPQEKLTLPEEDAAKNEKKTVKPVNIVMGIVFVVLFLIINFTLCGDYTNKYEYLWETLSILMLFCAFLNFIPKRELFQTELLKEKKHIGGKSIMVLSFSLLIAAFTVLFGIYFWGDRKYYFISLLIIIEAMIPFAVLFEGRKPKTREIVIVSVLCATAVGGRAAFAFLPQFKPVTAIIIIAAVCFGGETGFMVGAVSGFVSNFFFSQGPWTPWQMFAFGTVGFISGIFAETGLLRKTRLDLCIYGFFVTLIIYGGIMNPASVLMMQPHPTFKMILLAYLSGLPCDLVHALSTVFFLWFGAEAFCEKLERVKIKYGLRL